MVLSVLVAFKHQVRTGVSYIRYQFFPASFLSFVAGGLLENLLQCSNAQKEDFDLVPYGDSFLEIKLTEKTLR